MEPTTQTLTVGKRTYKLIETLQTEGRFPNIFRMGVVKVHTVQFGNTVYTVNERANGTFSQAITAFKV